VWSAGILAIGGGTLGEGDIVSERVGFFVRGFGFTASQTGGLDVVVRATDSSHSPIIRKLHMTEDELYEMLALLGISAVDDVDEDDLAELDSLADEIEN